MELIVISENKLKIMMSAPDMMRYGLDENEFYLSVTNTREMLNKILHNCPVSTGFERIRPEDKILMQLYPEKNGGCELFVTKLDLDEHEEIKEDELLMSPYNENGYFLPKPQKKATESGKRLTLAYSFEALEFVLLVCRELTARKFLGDSSLYRNYDGKYYLFITPRANENEKSSPSSFISEFGELENTENALLHLSEHGRCIIEKNAIPELAEL